MLQSACNGNTAMVALLLGQHLQNSEKYVTLSTYSTLWEEDYHCPAQMCSCHKPLIYWAVFSLLECSHHVSQCTLP